MAVSALLVPARLQRDDDGEWVAIDEREAVDEATRWAWTARAPQIQPAASKTAGLTYLANVCACGALQGEWYLTEPDGPFFPLDDTGHRRHRRGLARSANRGAGGNIDE